VTAIEHRFEGDPEELAKGMLAAMEATRKEGPRVMPAVTHPPALASEAKASNALVAVVGYYAEALSEVTVERDVWCGRAVRAEKQLQQVLQQQVQLQHRLTAANKLLDVVLGQLPPESELKSGIASWLETERGKP